MTTTTRTFTDSFTESRARYVLGKIFDDFNGIFSRGFTNVSSDDLKGWRDDVQYAMERNALVHFELQFSLSGQNWTIRYEVKKTGIIRDDDSGGIDFYNIPSSAKMNIVLLHDQNNADVSAYLNGRGWVSGGAFRGADGNQDRTYSKNGFGVDRKIQGDF